MAKTRGNKPISLSLTLLLITVFLLTSGLVIFAVILKNLPDPEQFENRQIAQSTKIYDRTGETLLYEIHGEEKRTVIPFEEIPDYVKWATIAIEDDNFYNNPAFDWRAILRALITDLIKGKVVQGGSTITQQLAKNAFLSPEKTIIRKIKELVIAFELEKRYSKDEILNLYLNQIPYGGNAYGIEAASQTFFNKPAKNLSLAESALLASLTKAPTYYSPWGRHLDELFKRKDNVLEKMNQLGYIDDEEKGRAKKVELTFEQQVTGIKATHFVLETQEYLNNKYGEQYTESAGLRVITTLDWKLQQIAEKAVSEGAKRNTDLYKGHNAALVAQDAVTGQILAMVGSKNYFGEPEPENCLPGKNCLFEGNFNVATQGLRQPGSAMKPFAYAAAFEKGFTPDTVLFDLPTEFSADNPNCPLEVDFSNEKKECFHPQNFDNKFRGPVTLRTALAQSINIPSVKTLYLAGIDKVLALAKNFGINSLTERGRYGLSLVLGGGEITLKELVGAYSVFAQDGTKHRQTMILKITDSDGNLIEEYKDSPAQALDSQYARLINDILSDTEARSGLFISSLPLTIFPGHQVALKTGTTNDYRDAWTIGYTSQLVAGVWAGNNDNTQMERSGSSILAAIPIWSSFMREALKEYKFVSFNKPDPIISEKPVLNGKYAVNYNFGGKEYLQLHTILYYLDKNNPQGPEPKKPENDSQFKNWEIPILKWGKQTIENFSINYNQPLPIGAKISDSGPEQITINLLSPKSGEFINSGKVLVRAQIVNNTEVAAIQLYFNNELVDQRLGNFGKVVSYQFDISPKNTELQNSLVLKITDISDKEYRKEIILFR